nr:MAG TPA: hypothetical protein [Caudoviricetes sp.]
MNIPSTIFLTSERQEPLFIASQKKRGIRARLALRRFDSAGGSTLYNS